MCVFHRLLDTPHNRHLVIEVTGFRNATVCNKSMQFWWGFTWLFKIKFDCVQYY